MFTNLIKFKKVFLLFVVLLLPVYGSCDSREKSAVSISQVSSIEFAKKLVVGWNLGNTLDASNTTSNNSGLAEETSWGMPRTTKAMIKAVADAGFKTIRIPVSWHNHLTNTTNYTIDSEWMARVKQIVDWAIEEDLYVILNVHHDNQEAGKLGKGAGLFGFAVSPDNESIKIASKKYLESVWRQIATTFNNGYGDKLIFEVLNEPRAISTNLEWNIDDAPTAKKYSAVITEYENVCIAAIRATGGNNSKRFIMVPAYAATGTHPVMLSSYKFPTDTASDKLILSTHAYSPYNFAMANSDSIFGIDDQSTLDFNFSYLKANYTDKGIGVVMGEASASNKSNTAERIKWSKYYFGKAKEAGIPIVIWDNMVSDADGNENVKGGFNGEHHGWLDRKSGKWYFPSIIKAMMDTVGVKGYKIPEYIPPTPVTIGWNEKKAITISNEKKTMNWKSEYIPAASLFADAKEGSILKVSFDNGGALLRLTSSDWKTNYNTGDFLNGNAGGENIHVSGKELYYIITASDAAAWKAKGLIISGSGTVSSIKFMP